MVLSILCWRICFAQAHTTDAARGTPDSHAHTGLLLAGFHTGCRIPAFICSHSGHCIHFPMDERLLAGRPQERRGLDEGSSVDMGLGSHVHIMSDHDRPHSVLLFQIIPHAFHPDKHDSHTADFNDNTGSIAHPRIIMPGLASHDAAEGHGMACNSPFRSPQHHRSDVRSTSLSIQSHQSTMSGIPHPDHI